MKVNPEFARFRWMFPVSLLMIIVFVGVGPYLFPHLLDFVIRITLALAGIRLTYMVVCSSISLYKALIVPVRQPNEFQTDVTYAWVIPSYNEEESVINTTLNQLATHSRAKNNYVIFLAMEEHEMRSKEKAEKIIRVQQKKFRHIGYTIHSLAAGEVKGKASNVSYCVENFQHIMPAGIELDKVYVTVVDCDSLAPKEYIDEINARIYNNPEKSLKTTFCPTQIFARNNMEVPLLVRSFDSFHSMAHWNSTFIPGYGFAIPLSNYTVSYVTIKSIGFWDKYAEAIAEDAHTTFKSFWKHNSDYYGETIYTPFNQLNLQSGAGYIDNCRHKFSQVVRHALGLQEACYNLNKFLEQKVITFRSWLVVLYSIENMYFSAVIMPFLMLSLYFQIFLMEPTPARKAHYEFLHSGYDTIITVLNVIIIVMHHCFVRYSAARYYGRKHIAFWRVVEYYAFLLIGVWVLMVPSFVTCIIKGCINHQEYVTAPKNSN